jgi:hypothetical protein
VGGQLTLAHVESYNDAPPYPRRRWRMPALEGPGALPGERAAHISSRVTSDGTTLVAVCASEYVCERIITHACTPALIQPRHGVCAVVRWRCGTWALASRCCG